ncbi:hypothetical protein AXG93_2891s1030 [Marchantia polymorpha subsp. ruderalis]|uniref:Uncharacterized protein n=1 Tax=Marchantia polymorpha subsp. ruderalis TaxID=1480154 RepID=A0A176WLP1_MARPO|nr:hypothetical protein AXG93_2891s1030 [Marchantia polymorpha subsp. ruderalis]
MVPWCHGGGGGGGGPREAGRDEAGLSRLQFFTYFGSTPEKRKRKEIRLVTQFTGITTLRKEPQGDVNLSTSENEKPFHPVEQQLTGEYWSRLGWAGLDRRKGGKKGKKVSHGGVLTLGMDIVDLSGHKSGRGGGGGGGGGGDIRSMTVERTQWADVEPL